MLRIIRFGRQCSCHLQGKCVVVGRSWKPYIGQTVGGELYLMVLIGGAEERAAIKREKSTWSRKRGDEKRNERLSSCNKPIELAGCLKMTIYHATDWTQKHTITEYKVHRFIAYQISRQMQATSNKSESHCLIPSMAAQVEQCLFRQRR
jgi:hypothetical protein